MLLGMLGWKCSFKFVFFFFLVGKLLGIFLGRVVRVYCMFLIKLEEVFFLLVDVELVDGV